VEVEVEVHGDPKSGAVVLTPVRPLAHAEIGEFFEGLRDTRPPEPLDWP